MDYKQKALDHVRSVCPELMELSFGCEVEYPSDDELKIIGHTPHLEHWLRGMGMQVLRYDFDDNNQFVEFTCFGKELSDDEWVLSYNLTKDGENQSEEFYKAYCEIVGINNPK